MTAAETGLVTSHQMPRFRSEAEVLHRRDFDRGPSPSPRVRRIVGRVLIVPVTTTAILAEWRFRTVTDATAHESAP